jgi:hypothetical protein
MKDEIRQAFENRKIPHLNLKRNKDGNYCYEAARIAFCDFADGWQARDTELSTLTKQRDELVEALKKIFDRAEEARINDVFSWPYLMGQIRHISNETIARIDVSGEALAKTEAQKGDK